MTDSEGNKGLHVGDGHFLQFNFDYEYYPEDEYFDEGYFLARDMFAKSHLIIGEGGGCNHNHGLNMTHIANEFGKILMTPSGPSEFYNNNHASVFGMHIPSESYSFTVISQQWANRGLTAAIIYYGSGVQVRCG
jgi:hypothetical protein